MSRSGVSVRVKKPVSNPGECECLFCKRTGFAPVTAAPDVNIRPKRCDASNLLRRAASPDEAALPVSLAELLFQGCDLLGEPFQKFLLGHSAHQLPVLHDLHFEFDAFVSRSLSHIARLP
jgi:hypothetical protein